jgi:hypothetical protein
MRDWLTGHYAGTTARKHEIRPPIGPMPPRRQKAASDIAKCDMLQGEGNQEASHFAVLFCSSSGWEALKVTGYSW